VIPLFFACVALPTCRQRALGGEQPAASLAASPAAQTEYRSLESDWNAMAPAERLGLEPRLREFLHTHGDDPRAQVVRVYLGWVLIERGRLAEASEVLAPVREGPAGVTRDFAQVADAAILLGRGQPERALFVLRALDGKLIDPAARLAFAELHVRAALGARRWHEALEAMVDWIADAQPETAERAQRAIEAWLPRVPPGPAERSLGELQRGGSEQNPVAQRAPARAWLARALRARLSAVALERADAALARRLLATAPATARKSEVGQMLARLTAGVTARPQVAGRAFGLVLSVGSAELRRRSAAVAAGVTRALGLLDSSRGAPSVRLITRDEAGTEAAMSEALASLAGDGAVMLAAGLGRAGADQARAYAEGAHIPVLLLYPPTRADPAPSYTFVLGADPEEALGLLTGELGRLGARRIARVGGDGAPCGLDPMAKREGVDALVVLGNADCTRELSRELGVGRVRLGLGLDTSELFASMRSDPALLAVGAGRFPQGLSDSPPSWYEALGHDVAELVRTALNDFPTERVDDTRSVSGLHQRAQAALLGAEADLWTTERRGFGGARRMARAWTVVTGAAPGPQSRDR
jgi:hypothetical protein